MKWFYAAYSCLCFTALSAAEEAFSLDRIISFYNTFICEEKTVLSPFGLSTVCGNTPPLNPTAPMPPPPPVIKGITGYFPISIYNGTETNSPEEVFICVGTNGLAQLVTFLPQADEEGVIHYMGQSQVPTSPSGSYMSDHQYTYALNQFEQNGDYYTFYLPIAEMPGSRIMFSVGDRLHYLISPTGIIGVEGMLDPTSASYYQLHDKLEFTVTEKKLSAFGLFMNITLVDYYGLPLSFVVNSASGVTFPGPTCTGISPAIPRETIFKVYARELEKLPSKGAGSWDRLPLIYTSSDGSKTYHLRLYSTGTLAGNTTSGATALMFPADYLSTPADCNWVDHVWQNLNTPSSPAFYEQHKLYVQLGSGDGAYTVQSSEIGSDGVWHFAFPLDSPFGSLTASFPSPTGFVSPFFAQVGSKYPGMYTTPPGNGSPPNTTASNELWKTLSSAFIVGLLPIDATAGNPLSKEFIQGKKADYFADSQNPCDKPWFDFYSKVLRSPDLNIPPYVDYYTVPFSDFLGDAGLIQIYGMTAVQPQVFITIGSLAGGLTGNAPLFEDETVYNVQLNIPESSLGVETVHFGTNPNVDLNRSYTAGGSYPISGIPGNAMYVGVRYNSGPYEGRLWTAHLVPQLNLNVPAIPSAVVITITEEGQCDVNVGAAP